MKRRDFVAGALLAVARMPHAQAQQDTKVYRLALAAPSTPVTDMNEASGHPRYRLLFKELKRLGYIEGRNLVVERYSGEGRAENYPELARRVVHSKPDLIFSVTGRLTGFFKEATSVIPIVAWTADPIAFGLTTSLARPGGNVTGIVVDPGKEIEGKRIELLKEMVPGASRLAYITPRAAWESPFGAVAREAARRKGISLLGVPLESPIDEAEYRRAFAAAAAGDVAGVIIPDNEEHFTYRRIIIKLAEQARVPAIYPWHQFVELGGLMSYGIDISGLCGLAAQDIDSILKGAKPGDIPFQLPTTEELFINMTAAKALGLTIPATLLARADEVIE
jgi:putative tryptophan/tyrosine transport system substrate-binding protein